MNEVSIIINGVRYDAVCVNKDLSHPSCCNVCDIGSFCIQGDTCLCYTFDIDNNFVFKKSDKKFEPWVMINVAETASTSRMKI